MDDAFLQYPFLGALPHQVTIYQHVMLTSANEAFSFGLIGEYFGAGEVFDELLPPVGGRRRYYKYQLLGGGDFLNFLLFLNRQRNEVLNEDTRRNRGLEKSLS